MSEVQVNYYDLSRLENTVAALAENTNRIDSKVNAMSDSVRRMTSELEQLKTDFEIMVNEQRREAALQRATTELIRVRQEIENNFGNYKIVRNTMVGVLQATDVALVKKDTISRVTEELMLSTPKYWLAPCLVAVSAWIGNDRSLADRAIKEALKRDREKTAITMALICRRNKRTETCYEWLSIYFESQDPRKFNEGDFAYIDAYVNGVFGPDEKHVCDGYVEKWMNEIKSSDASYEQRQEEIWKNYCAKFASVSDDFFPELRMVSNEYNQINNYISRANSVGPIQQRFTQINDAYVDQEELKKEIDSNLMALISKYDEDEMELRKEEMYCIAVKKYRGDEESAKKSFVHMAYENENKVRNLIEQMYTLVNKESGVTTSQKKTALKLISSDINRGFDKYVEETKASFPQQVTLNINGFTAVEKDGMEREAIISQYCQFKENEKAAAINNAQATKAPMAMMIAGGVLGVIGIVLCFLLLPLGIISIIGGIVTALLGLKKKRDIGKNVIRITQDFEEQKTQGTMSINRATDEWMAARDFASRFNANGYKAVS